jgi:hypothetical protein
MKNIGFALHSRWRSWLGGIHGQVISGSLDIQPDG